MKIGCIIQARTGSTRFPGKVLQEILGVPLILRVVERICRSKMITIVVVATSDLESDNVIVSLLEKFNTCFDKRVKVCRGSEQDVLDRYYQAAKTYELDVIVRSNGDNPIQDYRIIDRLIKIFIMDSDLSYASTRITKRTWPFGMDSEVFSFDALKKSWELAHLPEEREHVTLFMRNHPEIFTLFELTNEKDLSDIRLSVDYKKDLEIVREIYNTFYHKKHDYSLDDILEYFGRK